MSINLRDLENLITNYHDAGQPMYQHADDLIRWIVQIITSGLDRARETRDRMFKYILSQQQFIEQRALNMLNLLDRVKKKLSQISTFAKNQKS